MDFQVKGEFVSPSHKKEENLLRLLGFPEWKIRYLRELDDFDFNKNRSFHRNESPTEVNFFSK